MDPHMCRFQKELHSCFLHAGDHTVTMLLKNGLSKPLEGDFHRCSNPAVRFFITILRILDFVEKPRKPA